MDLITNSRGSTYRACQRRHQFEYELRWRPNVSSLPLRFGTLYHAGLQQWWLSIADLKAGRGGDDRTPLAFAAKAVGLKLASGHGNEVDEWELHKVLALVRGYHYRWIDWALNQGIEVLEVERRFQAPLYNPESGRTSRTFALGGVIDLMLRVSGRTVLVEHKTTSGDIALGSAYWKRLAIDGQISTYYDGAAALGYSVDVCLYDVAKKPTLVPKLATPPEKRKYTQKATKLGDGSIRPAGSLFANMRETDETPPEFGARVIADIADNPESYYQMGEVPRLATELEEYRRDTWLLAQTLRISQRLNSWPRNSDACTKYNSFCPYWDVCTRTASIDDDARFYQSAVVHPELEPSICQLDG